MTGAQIIRARDLRPRHMISLDYLDADSRDLFLTHEQHSIEVAYVDFEDDIVVISWRELRTSRNSTFGMINYKFPLNYLVAIEDTPRTAKA